MLRNHKIFQDIIYLNVMAPQLTNKKFHLTFFSVKKKFHHSINL